jgi:uncharacterized protein YjbI with pentapeptide repeats
MEKCSKKSDLAAVASSTGDASHCDFAGASLKGMELVGIRFDGSNLRGARLRRTDLTRAKLGGTRHYDELRETLSKYAGKIRS